MLVVRAPGSAGLAVALAVVSLAAPAAQARSFALTDYHNPRGGGFAASALVRVAPVTGARVKGPALHLGDAVQGHAVSPDRRVVAFGGQNFGAILRVDLVRMRQLAAIRLGRGSVDVLAWPSPRRLIATASPPESKTPEPRTLYVVDPVARRVVERLTLGLVLATAVGGGGRVALLAAPSAGIGGTRLVSTGPDGAIRIADLPRITSGIASAAHRVPGLAVDFAADRAWVVSAGEPSADVDLGDGAVHDRPAVGAPSAAPGPPHSTGTQNPSSGPTRVARWLGHGLIGLAGSDSAIAGYRQAETPAGLRVLDTRTWTEQVIDAHATTFGFVGHTLLAGRAAYGLDGRLRFRLPSRRWFVIQRRLYFIADRHAQVRDPASGAILRRFPATDRLFTLFST